MEYTLKKLPKSKAQIEISLQREDFSPFFEKASHNLSQEIEIEGFRKGQVPYEVLRKKIPEDEIVKEAGILALEYFLEEILKKEDLKIIDFPKAQIKKLTFEEIKFEIEIVHFPKVSLPDYKKIAKETEKREIKVEEKEIEESLSYLQKSRRKFKRKKEPAQKGDLVKINFEMRQKGVKIEGGEGKDMQIILGETKILEEVQKEIIGMKENEKKEFEITLPKNFWKKELQGKKVEVLVELKEIFEVETPPLNDDFARSLGKFENLSSLKKSIKEGLFMEKEEAEKRRWQNEIIQKIAQKSDIDLPEILIEKEKEGMLNDFKKEIEKEGLSFKEYLAQIKKSEKELKEDFEKTAILRLKISFCLDEIAKRENIVVTKEELEKELNKLFWRSPHFREELEKEKEKILEYLYLNLREKKVLDFLYNLS